ncbi:MULTISPECIES: formyltetrahydrofolate deformylase [unclassified Robiginitalea]|uniref:formyltetrahydrofolate deformylase n=1 Tax=Robiginitalea TaxID=252306 RepID=UPI002349F4A9|nr:MULTISPECIES: formyltetrahydrofolate deformylase [unclassified Robiginitalea]MDC6355309.1 formyltetrahydrofolate deformylase [Robiginitalea sp. PM2]MDC6375476.1 formyltetrahydrofolate deformylase [Robiginitalea sp. SP8]
MIATILIHCPDQPGIIHSVTGFIHKRGGNVVYLDQHVEKEDRVFFMRLQADFRQDTWEEPSFREAFGKGPATTYAMEWRLYLEDRSRMALFVSKYNHCLYDLLSRYEAGELNATIPFILSNHPDCEPIARQFNIPYYCVPVTPESREKAEARQLELLREHQVDCIVLARYMQIIGPSLIAAYPNRILNIHHSFLPAFAGAKPYHAAFARGVKIIGATSHYVTEELDEGPIIAQDVTPVSHMHTVSDFIAKGRDLEKIVLARAVQLHLHRKTLVYNNKTVIFA